MAVTEVNEALGSPRAAFTLTQRNYVRTFEVKTNDRADGPITVVSDPRIPRKGQSFSSGNDVDLGSICIRVTPNRDPDAPKTWSVVCEYSTTSDEETDVEDKSPLDQVITISSEKVLRLADVDIAGNAIENAAGDPHDPPAEYEYALMVFNVRRGETGAVDIDKAQEYLMSINNDDYTLEGIQVKKFWSKLDDFSAREAYWEGGFYWDCNYVIKSWPIPVGDPHEGIADFSYWDLYLLEHGPHEIKGGDKVRCKNPDGEYILANLDATTGAQLAVGADPQYSQFQTKLRKPYSDFNFD